MKEAIVVGSRTSHGGVIKEGESLWQIDGRAAHLEGMKHYCPRCETQSTAIASANGMQIMGRRLILSGDKASCGAVFLPSQFIVRVEPHTAPARTAAYDEQFVLKTNDGTILTNTPFTITQADGSIIKGISDAQGKTGRISTGQSEHMKVEIGE